MFDEFERWRAGKCVCIGLPSAKNALRILFESVTRGQACSILGWVFCSHLGDLVDRWILSNYPDFGKLSFLRPEVAYFCSICARAELLWRAHQFFSHVMIILNLKVLGMDSLEWILARFRPNRMHMIFFLICFSFAYWKPCVKTVFDVFLAPGHPKGWSGLKDGVVIRFGKMCANLRNEVSLEFWCTFEKCLRVAFTFLLCGGGNTEVFAICADSP